MKKQFLILFAFISVLALSQVPQRFNKVIVTGDITSPKFIKTGSNADSVLLGNGSARAISAIKTDTVSLSNRINAKATGNGTANGTNTGDETLSSIKTKLGAVTSVSDGYLKYQDWSTFNGKQNALTTGNLTSSTNGVSVTNGSGAIIGTGTAINITTASASSGGLLSMTDWNNFNNKQPSGSYEPSFSKNTAFNKNFGTTTGTVLEGRTFGTAASSAVGDFQPIENQRLSTTNSPSFSSITSSVATGTSPLTVNSTTMVGNLNSDLWRGYPNNFAIGYYDGAPNQIIGYGSDGVINRFSSTALNSFIHTGLSTNYIPKWNGSNFVNSLISDDGSKIFIGSGGTANQVWEKLSVQAASGSSVGIVCKTGNQGIYLYNAGTGTAKLDAYDWGTSSPLDINIGGNGGKVIIPTTTPSTSPTTGALVVGGGIGADHVRANNFYGSLTGNASTATNVAYSGLTGTIPTWNQNTTGSAATLTTSRTIWGQNFNGSGNVSGAISGATTGDFSGTVTASSFSGSGASLTGVQLPITLTTNGTSGAATFSGNVLNVPNYAASGGVNQTQTTVNGSVNGNAICSMPFQTSTYKKVIILLGSFSGSLTYTFPTPFLFSPNIYTGAPGIHPATYSITTTSLTLSGGSNTNGWVTLEGF